jgi:hypothetical protein
MQQMLSGVIKSIAGMQQMQYERAIIAFLFDENYVHMRVSNRLRVAENHQRSEAAQRGGVLFCQHKARTERHVMHRGDKRHDICMRDMRPKRGARVQLVTLEHDRDRVPVER